MIPTTDENNCSSGAMVQLASRNKSFTKRRITAVSFQKTLLSVHSFRGSNASCRNESYSHKKPPWHTGECRLCTEAEARLV